MKIRFRGGRRGGGEEREFMNEVDETSVVSAKLNTVPALFIVAY